MTSLLGLPADRAPRVVLDTAVVVSALVFGGGAPSALREAWQRGRCKPMICKATLLDLQDKLARPQLGFSRAEQAAMLNEYLPYAGKVRVPEAEQALSEGAPMALALARLAMAGKAHALVSGDGEMLSLHSRFCCPILTLDDFLAGLAEQRAKRRAMQAPSGTAAP
jgi:predicted nucleic acid-binding protein